MQRDSLKQLLHAGPTRRFDVSACSRNIYDNSDTKPLLFSQSFLNNCILFKYVDLDEERDNRRHTKISTLIYMPYDSLKPSDGGESVIFCHDNFVQLCKQKLTNNAVNGKQLLDDVAKLKILDTVPTFSPFIIELAFQRANIRIPDDYLQLTPETRAELTDHLKSRLRPLIISACRTRTAAMDKAVEDLTSKVCRPNNLADVMPVVEALGLPPEDACHILEAWIGVTYFEYEYAILQPRLKNFAAWISGYDPHAVGTTQQNKANLSSMLRTIRQNIRDEWNDIVAISMSYRSAYDAMAFRRQLGPFVSFLKTAPENYWRMGDVLGKLEQTIFAWKHFMRRSNDGPLPYAVLLEVITVLHGLLLAKGTPISRARSEHDAPLPKLC